MLALKRAFQANFLRLVTLVKQLLIAVIRRVRLMLKVKPFQTHSRLHSFRMRLRRLHFRRLCRSGCSRLI